MINNPAPLNHFRFFKFSLYSSHSNIVSGGNASYRWMPVLHLSVIHSPKKERQNTHTQCGEW